MATRRALVSVLFTSVALVNAEEEKVQPAAIATAVTLLGSITFIMSLMYCLNNRDKDMKRYTYEVRFILKGRSVEFQILASMMHMLAWFVALQVALAFASGALSDEAEAEEPESNDQGVTERKKATEAEKELNSVFWAIMLAHLTGFATIHAWGKVQQLPWLRKFWWQPVGVVVLSALGQLTLRSACDKVRSAVAGADGEVDEAEKLWDEQADDAETDIIGLAISFNAVQAVRYFISGVFPDVEGGEEMSDLAGHTTLQKLGLLGTGALSLAALFVCASAKKARRNSAKDKKKSVEDEEETKDPVERTLTILMTLFAMYNAWACFYTARWFLAGLHQTTDGMQLAVAVAIFISGAAFAAIKGLDFIADNEVKNEHASNAEDTQSDDGEPKAQDKDDDDDLAADLRAVISSLSLLIGFAWEQLFDQAVDCLSEGMNDRYPGVDLTCKVILTVFVVTLVAPAWRLYILPMVIHKGWRTGFVMTENNLRNIAREMKKEEFDSLHDKIAENKWYVGDRDELVGVSEVQEKTLSTAVQTALANRCPYMKSSQNGEKTVCGNYFAPDAVFCRRCGHKRPAMGAKAEDSEHGPKRLSLGSIHQSMLSNVDQLKNENNNLRTELDRVKQELVLARANEINSFSTQMSGLLDSISIMEATSPSNGLRQQRVPIQLAPSWNDRNLLPISGPYQSPNVPQSYIDPLYAPLLAGSRHEFAPHFSNAMG